MGAPLTPTSSPLCIRHCLCGYENSPTYSLLLFYLPVSGGIENEFVRFIFVSERDRRRTERRRQEVRGLRPVRLSARPHGIPDDGHLRRGNRRGHPSAAGAGRRRRAWKLKTPRRPPRTGTVRPVGLVSSARCHFFFFITIYVFFFVLLLTTRYSVARLYYIICYYYGRSNIYIYMYVSTARLPRALYTGAL